jgi:hypothetical protein
MGETHQPDWVVYVRLCASVEDKCLNHFKNILKRNRNLINFGQIFDFSFSKERERPVTEEEKTYCTLNKL